MRTVMKPHSKSGLKKFFPKVPDMAAYSGAVSTTHLREGEGKHTDRFFVEIRASGFEDEYRDCGILG